jgi:single-strand DNA-binding protein
MFSFINSVHLRGTLGKDVEVKEFEGGKVAKFSIANNEYYYDKEKDEYVQKAAHWFDVECWNSIADKAIKKLKKGSKVTIEGNLVYETWEQTDKNTGEVKKLTKVKVRATRLEIDDQNEELELMKRTLESFGEETRKKFNAKKVAIKNERLAKEISEKQQENLKKEGVTAAEAAFAEQGDDLPF